MAVERHITTPQAGFAAAVSTSGAGRTIHVSGNVGFGDDGKVVSGGVETEARATFANIEKVLNDAGASMSDVVRITAFLTDLDAYGDFAKVRSEVFGENLPASAAVQVAGLLVGAQIEIDAIAFIPEG